MTRNDQRHPAGASCARAVGRASFINVLQGRMWTSPAPACRRTTSFTANWFIGYMVRHKVKPGITGWRRSTAIARTDTVERCRSASSTTSTICATGPGHGSVDHLKTAGGAQDAMPTEALARVAAGVAAGSAGRVRFSAAGLLVAGNLSAARPRRSA